MTILGWKASTEQFSAAELLDCAVAAEQAGFDSFEVSDHFHPWSEEGQAAFVWTWLGAAAARTGRIRMGTGVTCPILRYHPAVIAQATSTLASMADGRVFLSVGTGEALNEYSATGQWPDYHTRQAMLKEAIQLMRELWTGKEVSFDGDFYRTRKARLYTMLKQSIPLYVSTLVPESADFAGRYGDGFITTGGREPEQYRKMMAAFETGASQAGRDPAKMPKLIELSVGYAEDIAGVIQEVKRYWSGTFVPAMYTQRIYTPKMSAENGKPVGEEAIRSHGCFSSDLDDHVKFAQRYIDLGFTELHFHYAGTDQQDFIQRYAKDVLPKLRP